MTSKSIEVAITSSCVELPTARINLLVSSLPSGCYLVELPKCIRISLHERFDCGSEIKGLIFNVPVRLKINSVGVVITSANDLPCVPVSLYYQPNSDMLHMDGVLAIKQDIMKAVESLQVSTITLDDDTTVSVSRANVRAMISRMHSIRKPEDVIATIMMEYKIDTKHIRSKGLDGVPISTIKQIYLDYIKHVN